MGVRVATTSTFHQWVAHPVTSSAICSPSRRRSIGRSVSCRFLVQSQKLNPSSLFGTSTKKNLRHSKSFEKSSRPTKTQLIRRDFSTNVDPFSDEEFLKEMHELALKFQVSNDEYNETETGHDDPKLTHDSINASHSFSTMEPPWPEMVHMSSIERKANSVDLPLSIRIIQKKLQMEERVKQVSESACSSVTKAFSSMVFMIRELQSFTLCMRELLLFDDLQGILHRVRKEIHASFVWLFQQVFSATPTLMASVMIILANYTVYSIGNNSALAAPVTPHPPTTTVSFTFETTELSETQKFETYSVSSPNGKMSFVGGGSGGGSNIPPVESGTVGDGSDHFRTPSQFPSSSLGPTSADTETSVSGQEESRLWSSKKQLVSPVEALQEAEESLDHFKTELLYQTGLSQKSENVLLLANYTQFLYLIIHDYDRLWSSILDKSEKMEALNNETKKQFVAPVEARLEAEESIDHFKTELLYQTGLSQEPGNVLLLANYAQFLYLIIHDYDRAEKYFKRAAKAEPADAEALNKYATFLWKARNDIWRAEETYLEAISVDPSNSVYSANYAHFLWNTGGGGADDTCFPFDAPPQQNTT